MEGNGWSEMNCLLNKTLKPNNEEVYISENEPVNFKLPAGIKYKVYDNRGYGGTGGKGGMTLELKEEMMEFIRRNDRTDSGNVTELSEESLNRIIGTRSIVIVLVENNKIIGTIISLIFRVQYKNEEKSEILDFLTTYTTFLCVDGNYREKGLAMCLIRGMMKYGHKRYGIQHGYYMTYKQHHSVNEQIKSWYRPINIQKVSNAGFTVQSFPQKYKRDIKMNERLGYHIGKPKIEGVKCTSKNYEKVKEIMKKGEIYLNPTEEEYKWLCECFDIYTVGSDKMFMLFPLTSLISSTNCRVTNAQLALMIGDALPQVLWTAKESGYDLLYGWYGGDITELRVEAIKGLKTIGKGYLEIYNSKRMINAKDMMVPIF